MVLVDNKVARKLYGDESHHDSKKIRELIHILPMQQISNAQSARYFLDSAFFFLGESSDNKNDMNWREKNHESPMS